MGLSVIKCFSVLVSSGNGQKCNVLSSVLRDHLFDIDKETGATKIAIYKTNNPKYVDDHRRIGSELSKVISPIINSIPDYFFGPDKNNVNERN